MEAIRKLDLGRTAIRIPVPAITKKDYSDDERKGMAKEGTALPDGSYPIANSADLHHAIELSGMGSDPKDEIKAHIKARAKALGLCSAVPTTWKSEDKTKCPSCGSRKYALMPSDFETAKCAKCGKNWDHGIVDGVNNPYDAKKFEAAQKNEGAPDYGDILRNKRNRRKLPMQATPMDITAIQSQIDAANS